MSTLNQNNRPVLIDRFGRRVNYLRVSVTDRCDYRCVYCMSEDIQFTPRERLLTLEENLLVARAFTELGVTKIRITGGEPLVRRNIHWLLQEMHRLPGLQELVLTTNGSQLEKYAEKLHDAGVRRINISLDSLKPERFKKITRIGDLDQVLRGIEAVKRAGFERLKLNSVILKNYNDDEILDLVQFALEKDIDLTFIEEMPLGFSDEYAGKVAFFSSDEVQKRVEERYKLLPTTDRSGGPARYFKIPEAATRIGFISPHTHNFCNSCNRVRLTAEGRLLLCLGQQHSADLRQVMRTHPGELEPLKQAITKAMDLKPEGHDFSAERPSGLPRNMNVTGG